MPPSSDPSLLSQLTPLMPRRLLSSPPKSSSSQLCFPPELTVALPALITLPFTTIPADFALEALHFTNFSSLGRSICIKSRILRNIRLRHKTQRFSDLRINILLCQKQIRQRLDECINKKGFVVREEIADTVATQTHRIEDSGSRRRRVMKARACPRPYSHRFSLRFWPIQNSQQKNWVGGDKISSLFILKSVRRTSP
ncbi:hypothetical protein Rs2_29071 [Raphanus sativus]|nr:hypothetical protein Rs2_29071 [Raphanus sativus]